MKLWILISAIVLLAPPRGSAAEQSMLARVTVYWHGPGKQQYAFSNGIRLRNGHCAVDPKRIPFGSRIIFTDGSGLAVDTGPAVVSRKAARRSGKTARQRGAIVVDRYFESRKEALAWADSHSPFMIVRVLDSPRPFEEAPPPDRFTIPFQGTGIQTASVPAPIDRTSNGQATSPSDIRGLLVPAFLIAFPRDS